MQYRKRLSALGTSWLLLGAALAPAAVAAGEPIDHAALRAEAAALKAAIASAPRGRGWLAQRRAAELHWQVETVLAGARIATPAADDAPWATEAAPAGAMPLAIAEAMPADAAAFAPITLEIDTNLGPAGHEAADRWARWEAHMARSRESGLISAEALAALASRPAEARPAAPQAAPLPALGAIAADPLALRMP